MTDWLEGPAFGTADLSNCERELIHLPGSVQPHGVLVVLEPEALTVVQATENLERVVGRPVTDILGSPAAAVFGAAFEASVRRHLPADRESLPDPFLVHPETGPGGSYTGLVHSADSQGVMVELEAFDPDAADAAATAPGQLADVLDRLSSAGTFDRLADTAAGALKRLTGYDRVMVYRFDPDGHGEVVAEAREPELEPFLGLHYPASDIPMRARQLYLRNRVRVLVDVDYDPSPLVPRLSPLTGDELDMSLVAVRSMSPIHLQYLRNMGVTGTLVASLVRDGELWGLIACHHYSAKEVPYAIRAAVEVACEVISTCLTVLETRAMAAAEMNVRRLEARVVAQTSEGRGWRSALFEAPELLLKPMDAAGVSVAFEGEIRSAGEVPSTGDVRRVVRWVAEQDAPLVHCRSLGRHVPSLGDLAGACGVLAVALSQADDEYLLWFRREQRQDVRWAGDPRKPVQVGDDPRDLSPRRSFAVWTEEVEGTSKHWTPVQLQTARLLGGSLRDLIVQVRSLSYLVSQRQTAHYRATLQRSEEAVLLADPEGRVLFVNEAFSHLFRRPHPHLDTLDDVPRLFADRGRIYQILDHLRSTGCTWRGQALLEVAPDETTPVAVGMEAVRGQGREHLGFVLILRDLTETMEVESRRARLGQSIRDARPDPVEDDGTSPDELRRALRRVLDNAASAVEIPWEGAIGPLEDMEDSTRRALDLTRRLGELRRDRESAPPDRDPRKGTG